MGRVKGTAKLGNLDSTGTTSKARGPGAVTGAQSEPQPGRGPPHESCPCGGLQSVC